MAYYGNAPADVALVVGSDVITTTEIQDATIATADIANDAITAVKIDDDGTGFQMGSLGLGTAVSGSEKLTVGGTASFTGNTTINGDCGIGTANPQESIHTTGNIRFGDSAPAELYTNSSELRLGVDRNADNDISNITFYTNNDEKVRIDAGGSIISNVNGNADVGLRLQRASSSGRAQYTLENESGTELWRCGLTGAGGTTYTFWNTSANVLQLSYSDNSATFGGSLLGTDGSTSSPAFSFSSDTNTGMYRVGTDAVGLVAGGSRKFYVNDTTAYFQNLSGGVEIAGDVTGDSFYVGVSEQIRMPQSDGNRYGAIQVDQTAGSGQGTDHSLRIISKNDYGTSYNQRITMETAGSERFVVEYNGVCSGNLNDTSDVSLKKTIQPIESSLNIIKELNPVSFYWKKGENRGEDKQKGFIAQEVESIIPEVVHGEDGNKSINVTGIVAQLTKAVQELSDKVTALENA